VAVKIRLEKHFNDDDLKGMIRERVERIEKAVLSRLQFIGEHFVRNARSNDTYRDRTGNLRTRKQQEVK
jgi:beta-N-acetylglucosaminidase